MIITDSFNPEARVYDTRLRAHLPDGLPREDLHVVIGGDGFMLRTIAEHGLDYVYLGLNMGNLGFLLNDAAKPRTVAERLLGGDYSVGEFPLLRAVMTTMDGAEVIDHAVNDVWLERATSQAARLKLRIDGHVVVENLLADGIIFSTALGSTGYSFSAGGTACHPQLSMLNVTAIAPHIPQLDPFALPRTSTARVEVLMADRRPVRAVADGRSVEDVRSVEVDYDGEVVRLAHFNANCFTARMIRKLLRP